MAEPIAIPGSSESAKLRSPVLVVVWSLLTLGIYGIVWYYKINKELAEMGRARGTDALGTSPGTSLLAVTLGGLVIVPAIVSLVNTYKRLKTAQEMTGVQQPLNGWIALILAVFLGPVMYAYFQSGQNATLRAAAGSLPQAAPEPALA